MYHLHLAFLILLLLSFESNIHAQENSFEGIIEYQVDIKSKINSISDETVKTVSGYGNSIKIYFKDGKYYRISGFVEEYLGFNPNQTILKYKNRDTLYSYYDTTDNHLPIQLKHTTKKATIADYACKHMRLTRGKEACDIYYAPDLQQNASKLINFSGGIFYRFAVETGAVWLKMTIENEIGISTFTAIKIKKTKVDDQLFQLPQLPITNFKIESMIRKAEPQSQKEWIDYLQRSMNAELANKYLKIPKGDSSVKQTLFVEFVVTQYGTIGDVVISNYKEAHPALAKEAIRVIKEAYGWKPAEFLGHKIDSWVTIPLTFMSSY